MEWEGPFKLLAYLAFSRHLQKLQLPIGLWTFSVQTHRPLSGQSVFHRLLHTVLTSLATSCCPLTTPPIKLQVYRANRLVAKQPNFRVNFDLIRYTPRLPYMYMYTFQVLKNR